MNKQKRKPILKYQFSEIFKLWMVTLIALPIVVFYRFFEGIPGFANFQLEGKIYSFVVGGGIIVSWIFVKLVTKRRIHQTDFDVWLLVIGLVTLLKIPFSRDTHLSVDYSIIVIGYLLTIYFFLDIHEIEILRKGLINAILITTVISLFYIFFNIYHWLNNFQVSFSDLASPGYVVGVIPRLSLTRDPNLLAVNIILVLPLFLFCLTSAKKKFWKMSIGLLILTLMIVLLLTKSRGGLLGFGSMLVIYLFVKWKRSGMNFLKDKRVLFVGGIIFLLLILGSFNIIISRGVPEMLVGIARINIWKATLRMINDHRIIGIGLGTFGSNYIDYRDPMAKPYLISHTHNGLLNLLVYFGLVGTLIILLIIFTAIKGHFKDVFGGKINPKSLRFACFLGIIGYLGHGLVDSFFNTPGVIYLVLFLFSGLVYVDSRSGKPISAQLFIVLFMLCTLGAGVLRGYQIYQGIPYAKSRAAALRANEQKALKEITVGLERSPHNPFYQFVLSNLEARRAYIQGENPASAISSLKKTINEYPGWAPNYGNLALLYFKKGSYVQAQEIVNQAVEYHPYEARFLCLQGEILEKIPRASEAMDVYGKCLAEKPASLKSNYWQNDGIRSQRLESIIEKAERYIIVNYEDEAQWKLASLYFYSNEMDKFYEQLHEMSKEKANQNQVLSWETKIYFLEGQYEESSLNLKKLIYQNPRIKSYWDILAECYLATGNKEDAERALRISLALGESAKTYTLLGKISESSGDIDRAIYHYQRALISLGPNYDSVFSTFVARSAPYPLKNMAGYPELFPDEIYSQTLERLNHLVGEKDCTLQKSIYQIILDNSPGLHLVRDSLSSLSCTTED